MRFGPWEIGLILVIILIVFGVGKLPQVGEALGRGIKSFRKAQTGEEDVKPGASSELELTKARLDAAETRVKLLETQTQATAKK